MKLLRMIAIFQFVLTASSIASAQSQEGRILGTVTDQSGGLVKGTRVTITNVDTGGTRTLETNDAGDYVAPSLPSGRYKLLVEETGFKKIERGGIRREVAKDLRLDVTMLPGSVTEVIEVVEQVPLVETTNDTLGGTFGNKSINDLPLNGRDFQNLVVLRPGVQRTSGGGFLSISSNGNRPEDNNFIVDGTDNNDPYYAGTVINAEGVQGTPGSILPIDAIQEFNAEENPPAEYGWKPGAIVNVGLKSGTNDVHGSVYDFERNNAFDARNFFNPKIDPNTGLASPQRALRLHQFGGSLGGPIVKNKTFLFWGYEAILAQVGNSRLFIPPMRIPTRTASITPSSTSDCRTRTATTISSSKPTTTSMSGTASPLATSSVIVCRQSSTSPSCARNGNRNRNSARKCWGSATTLFPMPAG